MFIVFSFTYGNALAEQKRSTEYRIHTIINDLNNLDEFNDSSKRKFIQIHGEIGKSLIIKNMPQNYEMLKCIKLFMEMDYGMLLKLNKILT